MVIKPYRALLKSYGFYIARSKTYEQVWTNNSQVHIHALRFFAEGVLSAERRVVDSNGVVTIDAYENLPTSRENLMMVLTKWFPKEE